jgi:hypothetical protein
MQQETLRETLARLHAELERAEPIDAALRADLERALEEIRAVMLREPRREEEAHPLRARLEALALDFERSHPLLTEALGGVMRALGAMGI